MVMVGMLDLAGPEKHLKAYPFAAVAKAEGIGFFYFQPQDVDLETKTIRGKFYENGQWIEKQTTFPDVIYNANGHVKSEEEQLIIEALKALIPFTSWSVGNKMKVFNKLTKSALFSRYLPDTMEVKEAEAAIDFINEKEQVILKPRNGRKGKGILYVRRMEDEYEVRGDNEQQRMSRRMLSSLLTDKIPEKYIIQTFIQCRNQAGLTYDLRLHVQKDGTGRWTVCSIYPRIAPPNSVKANISSGGAALYITPFLKQEFGEDYFNMQRYLEVFAISISKEMDKLYKRSFDELGIDIGIDSSGKVWLYEINWHPGVPPAFYLELDVVKTSLAYCCYLAHASGAQLSLKPVKMDKQR